MRTSLSYFSLARTIKKVGLTVFFIFLICFSASAGEPFQGVQRNWTIYLVQHTHTDIGYTKPQTEILSEHLRYIDYAIDYSDLTKDYPDDARFRWTCESAWAVSEYIKVRPAAQVERLRACIKRGQIEVAAMYFNMAEVADENSLRYFLLPLQYLRAEGIPFTLAMQNDVNGAAWCLADYLPDVGVKYLWMGEHTARALEPFDKPTVFRWESPSGKCLYAFRAEHYMTGNFWGIETGDMGRVEEKMGEYLRQLEGKGYPFSEIGIQYSGYFTDNAPPSYKVCDFIANWNKTHEWPKLRSATAHEFMDHVVSNYADKLDSYRKAWPDWWTDGFGSAQRETGEARKAQADMLSTQGLLSMAALEGMDLPEGINTEIEGIHNNLLFYDEHTFGAAESISDPSCWQSHLQWGCKGSYAWTAQKRAQMLYETAGGLLQSFIHRDEVPTITFFNPLTWERDAYCDIYIDYEIIPNGVNYAIVDENGQEVMAQPYSSRSEGRYFRVFVKDLPSLGYRTYRIQLGGKDNGNASNGTADANQLENDYYRLAIDPVRGGISSIYDKKAQREMVDNKCDWEAGQLIYEKLADRGIMMERTSHSMERTSMSDVKVTQGANGPLYKSLIVEGKCPGLTDHGVRYEVKLYNDQPRVELGYTMRTVADTNPTAYYVAFPFTGEQLEFDVPGGFVKPGENQLEGTSSDWNTIQNFVSARTDGYQILLSSKEVPLVQLGDMLDGPFEYIKHYERAHVFSWVTNNYWFTNFRASQEGEMQWRYTITSRQDTKNTEALKFALGDRVQAYARVLPIGTKDNQAMEGSLLEINDNDLMITSMAPAQKKGYLILQVRETSGCEGKKLQLTSKGKIVRFDKVNALEEVQKSHLQQMDVPAYGDVLIRIKAK